MGIQHSGRGIMAELGIVLGFLAWMGCFVLGVVVLLR